MNIESYFLVICSVCCVAFVYFSYKHVDRHEKSDSKATSNLPRSIKNKKGKKV